MYNRDDINADNAIDLARRHPELFFGDEGYSAARVVEFIRAEAEASGVSGLEVQEVDGWWTMAAEDDWLPPDEEGLRAFHENVHLPELGINASRSEVLLTAFASLVVTSKNGNVTVVVDTDHAATHALERFSDLLERQGRVIVFRS